MGKYVLKRILLLIPTMILVCVIVFVLMRLVPGSAVDMVVYQYQQNGIEITYEEAEAKLGLDKPAVVQFFEWFGGILTGDLGDCLFTEETVWSVLKAQIPVSLELSIMTLVLSELIGIPLGLYCASHPDTPGDVIIRTLGVIMGSVPVFWIGTIVLVYPAMWWGYSPPLTYVSFFESPLENLQMFLIPAILGALTSAGNNIRTVRTMTLEVMRQDYVRTAWAKGAKQSRVMTAHAFRNALIPIITMIGGSIAGLLGGNVVMENLFNIPGIGQQVVTALNNRDYPLAQGCTVVFALYSMIVILIVDLLYTVCDPRVSLE